MLISSFHSIPHSSVIHALQPVVKVNPYKYPTYLKVLAKHKLEDSERLPASVRQQLPRLRQACSSSDFYSVYSLFCTCVYSYMFSVCSQTRLGHRAVHEDLQRALPSSLTPGGDTDGGGHQEV